MERVQRQIGSNFCFKTDGRKINDFSRNTGVKGTFIRKISPEAAMAKYHDATAIGTSTVLPLRRC